MFRTETYLHDEGGDVGEIRKQERLRSFPEVVWDMGSRMGKEKKKVTRTETERGIERGDKEGKTRPVGTVQA